MARPPGSAPPSRPSGRRTGPISRKTWCGTGSSSPSCPSGCKTPSCSRATSPTAAPGLAVSSPGWRGGPPLPPGPEGLSPAAAERAGRAVRGHPAGRLRLPEPAAGEAVHPGLPHRREPHPLSDPGAGDLLLLRQRLHRPADPPGTTTSRGTTTPSSTMSPPAGTGTAWPCGPWAG